MIEPLDPDDGTYLVTRFHDRLFAGQMITLVPGEIVIADREQYTGAVEIIGLIGVTH